MSAKYNRTLLIFQRNYYTFIDLYYGDNGYLLVY